MSLSVSTLSVNSSSAATPFTAVPNYLLDEVIPGLSHTPTQALLLLHIVRKTCGYHKVADAISLKQFQEGSGVKNRTAIVHGLHALTEQGIIGQMKHHREDGGDATTVYYLLPPSTGEKGGSAPSAPPPVRPAHSQKKLVPKEKILELETPKPPVASDPDRDGIATTLATVGEQLGTVFTVSHITRALNLMRDAGFQLAVFCLMLVEALRLTQQRQRTTMLQTPAAYYFTVLEGMIAQEQQKTAILERSRRSQSVPEASEGSGTPPQDLWGHICQEIAARVTSDNYARWIRPTHQLAQEGDTLTIAVGSAFDHYWLDQRLRTMIERCARLIQPGLAIRFEVQS